MKKEVFFERVLERVSAYYGENADVSAREICKNNGLKKYGISVRKSGSNCAPTVYLDDIYRDYMGEESVCEVADSIIEILDSHMVDGIVDASFFMDLEKSLSKICFRLISVEKNAERLLELPHRVIGDIAVVYVMALEFGEESGSIFITNDHADMWGVSEEDLYEAAMDNTPRLFPASCRSIFDFCSDVAGIPVDDMRQEPECEFDDEIESVDDKLPPYGLIVVTNTKMIYGSAAILYPGLLKDMSEKYNCNFYIIPSSVHEVILIPEKFVDRVENIQGMVREVNSSCVPQEDFLSNSVYYYDREGENNVKKVEQASVAML
jgi:hypothetical protein